MRYVPSKHSQHGITLVVGMIMLILITLMVTTAFTLSTTNLKAVGNMQAKDEAVAAANKAIEQVISSAFTVAPQAEEVIVDINNDGSSDYTVSIAKPECIRAPIEAIAVSSSVTLGTTMSTVNTYNTMWSIKATVNDARTGAKTKVHAGVRVLLTQTQKDAVCS